MSRIHVSHSEIQKAAFQNWQGRHRRELPEPTRNVLIFYGVECAVKARYMRLHNIFNTERLMAERVFGDGGHDLKAGLKPCRIPATISAPPTVHRVNKAEVPFSSLHQAWRYGASLETKDETSAVEWLCGLFSWLEANR